MAEQQIFHYLQDTEIEVELKQVRMSGGIAKITEDTFQRTILFM